jgi:hypothetical protein
MKPIGNAGEIVPGERIGIVALADSMDEVVAKLSGRQIRWEERRNHRILHADPYSVWFDIATQGITQISVGKGFSGLFLARIGIGSTLREVGMIAGRYYDREDAYHLEGHPGICFELEDVDNWTEETAPIEFITIFAPPTQVSSDCNSREH